MALFRRLFYRKPPDRLLEISERVYVFDCCFSTDTLGEQEYSDYLNGIVTQLNDYFPEASFMVFNFREGNQRSHISDILSDYGMTIMDYPVQYEGCPLLPLEMIHHFLKSSESWLSLEGQHNVLLMHCERGGWPVLAFMLAGLLLYRKQYTGEHKTLDMVYRQAPKELLHLLSPLNPQSSHLRYLEYISRRGNASEWPPNDMPLTLESLILRVIPNCDGEDGCRPMVRIHGQDPLAPNRNPKILFATSKTKMHIRHHKQGEGTPLRIKTRCRVQGDVVIECIHMDKDLENEKMMFRVMFNTAFVQSNTLILSREEIDVVWNSEEHFPRDFKAEVIFSDFDAYESDSSSETSVEDGNETEGNFTEAEEFFEAEEIFTNADWHNANRDSEVTATKSGTSITGVNTTSETYSLAGGARNRFERSKDQENSNTRGSNEFAGVVAEITMTKTPSVPGPAEAHSEFGKSDHDDDFVTEKSVTSEYVVHIEEKGVIESSTRQQNFKGVASFSEEKNFNNINKLKVDSEGVPMKTTNLICKNPSQDKINHERGTDYIRHPDNFERYSVSTLRTPQETITKFPTISSILDGEIISENSISLEDTFPCHEKNIVEVNEIEHEVKEIVAVDVEEMNIVETCKVDQDADNQIIEKTTTSCNMISTKEIATDVEALSEKIDSKFYRENGTMRKTLVDNGCNQEGQNIARELKCKPKKETESSVTEKKTETNALPQKTKNNEQKQTSEVYLCSTMEKSRAPPPPPPGPRGGPPPPPPPSGPRGGAPPPPTPPRAPGAPPPPPTNGQVDARGALPNGGRGRGLTRSTASNAACLAPRRSSLKPLHWVKVTRAVQGSLWAELQRSGDASSASEFDVSELESLFSTAVPKADDSSKSDGRRKSVGSKSDKVHLIELRRANNTEIMLTKVKMPLPDMMSAALALDDSILDVDQVENLIKFCPTKEEMELLKGYMGDKEKLGKCEQFFLELMKVPRVESKLRVFSFKIQFGSQVSDLRKSLNTIDSACAEIRNSDKLKEIMKKILFLGNTLNQGTARGSAIGFRLDSLLKLTDTRATNNKMTLMHYLCKVIALRSPHLLDFHEDLISLEAASKIQLKSLAEEMQAIVKGLEKVGLELNASENDGPVSEIFRRTLKGFVVVAGAEVQSLTALYTAAGRNADALALYFGEDPARCPFEQVISTLSNFVSMFRKAHQDNCKQAELDKKKAEKEREIEKSKTSMQNSKEDLKQTSLSEQLGQAKEKVKSKNKSEKDIR
ncbi:formin-like protein 5 [Curcuma longa]|uniref:formin-like protein 5 n=1 Tax=Curcuma longa TaxID=136217 RepID=UPI003D9F8351